MFEEKWKDIVVNVKKLSLVFLKKNIQIHPHEQKSTSYLSAQKRGGPKIFPRSHVTRITVAPRGIDFVRSSRQSVTKLEPSFKP